MKRRLIFRSLIGLLLLTWLAGNTIAVQASPTRQSGGANPPERVVKLIFIHHSTGENWLTDGYGDLGRTLAENNYYVSDTNYGWGPNGIGDRTDIPDWEEWFHSGDTGTYMAALFNENEQHADYSRPLSDPGGENEIVLFKSCFPNSDLEGSPDDPPSADGWLSVGHAKYVYNQILEYFGQHPEKLFVVITAPPLSDRSNAANARAFNLWLLNDWLEENDYPYSNVAVFDFYNVLTGKDGHHTFQDGQEVHQIASKDTLAYPSGDDHPSKAGSQKATEEFIPLLNYFYQRWQAENPSPLPAVSEHTQDDSPAADQGPPPEVSGLIDNFEGEAPAGSNGWEAYWDEGTPSFLGCEVVPGTGLTGNGLQVEYRITAYSWGTCGLSFDNSVDWSAASGMAFTIRTDQAVGPLHVDLYADGPDGRESYLYELELKPEMKNDWVQVGVAWDSFQRVEWEEGAGTPFNKPDKITGLAFGFGTEDSEVSGMLWIDDLGWMDQGSAPGPEQESPAPAGSPDDPGVEQEESGGLNLPCIGSLAAPLSLAGAVIFYRKRK